ncbi:MAG: Tim44 domain-containing protein [Alphaproteobacteria bacterium]|nr:Tim44 domain-containing protein [Alphaproteobacteria bacterium]MCW5741095.1 Tim44 domain-containing protein [Alphaproteobacteria bacterium]
MGSHIEIILIALVAIFLVLRLRSVLGRRTGNERPPTQEPFAPPAPTPEARRDNGNVVQLPRPSDPLPPSRSAGQVRIAAAAGAGIEAIRDADRSFDPQGFAGGARAAFEMIVGAFAKGDLVSLRPLLDDATYASFEAAVKDRQAHGRVLETSLIGFDSTELVRAELRGSVAHVTMRFTTEQINVTRDADGLMVEGNPNTVERVTDVWTFARDTRSENPNWLLVGTDSES